MGTSADPIFVFGMTARTGTNYLRRLLCLHPDCKPFAMHEDFLFTNSDGLIQYSEILTSKYESLREPWYWSREKMDRTKSELFQSVGGGVL